MEAARCFECGGTMQPGTTTWCSSGDTPVIATKVPALVCRQCGAEAFTSEVVGELERLVRERPTPARTILVPVYEFQGERVESQLGAPATHE